MALPLAHEWASPLLAASEGRRRAEAELAAARSRISFLAEATASAARSLLHTRQSVARANTFLAHAASGEGTDTRLLRRPVAGDLTGTWAHPSANDVPRTRAATWRSSLPPVSSLRRLASPERSGEVAELLRTLRETKEAARSEAAAAEAVAFSEERRQRLSAIAARRAEIRARCSEMAEARRALVREWNGLRAGEVAAASAARREAYLARIDSEDATRAALEQEIRALASLEEQLLREVRAHPALRLEAISPRSTVLPTDILAITTTAAAIAATGAPPAAGAAAGATAAAMGSTGTAWAARSATTSLLTSPLASPTAGTGLGFSPLRSPTVHLSSSPSPATRTGRQATGTAGGLGSPGTRFLSSLPPSWKTPGTASSAWPAVAATSPGLRPGTASTTSGGVGGTLARYNSIAGAGGLAGPGGAGASGGGGGPGYAIF